MADHDCWVRVGDADLPPGGMRAVEVAGHAVALFRLEDGRWWATDNVCTHAYALLTNGWLDGTEIECPLHAARFDLLTGEALCAPATARLRVHAVRAEADGVLVRLAA